MIRVRGGRKKGELLCACNPVIAVVPEFEYIDSVIDNFEEVETNADNVECLSPPVEFPLHVSDVTSLESNQDESFLNCDLSLLLTPSSAKINSRPVLIKPLLHGSSHTKNKGKIKEINQFTLMMKGADYLDSVSKELFQNMGGGSSDLLQKRKKQLNQARKS